MSRDDASNAEGGLKPGPADERSEEAHSSSSTGYISDVQIQSGASSADSGAGGGVGGAMTLKSGQRSFLAGRVLVWFSRGAASTIALKLAVEKYGASGIEVLYCPIKQEHKDGERYQRDVSQWLGVEIKELRSKEFPEMDIYEVFRKHQYIAGIGGARCTRSLKREVRMAYQWEEDTHVFGYTADETMPLCKNPLKDRVRGFERDNPALFCDWLLVEAGIVKADCYRIIQDAGITLPLMYRMGYRNHNCICCVKGGAGYQNKCRRDFPEEFAEMARFSRAMGVKLVKVDGVRMFLDELPPDAGRYQDEPDFDCGPQCVLPSSDDDDFESEVAGRAAGAGVGLTASDVEPKKYNGDSTTTDSITNRESTP